MHTSPDYRSGGGGGGGALYMNPSFVMRSRGFIFGFVNMVFSISIAVAITKVGSTGSR